MVLIYMTKLKTSIYIPSCNKNAEQYPTSEVITRCSMNVRYAMVMMTSSITTILILIHVLSKMRQGIL